MLSEPENHRKFSRLQGVKVPRRAPISEVHMPDNPTKLQAARASRGLSLRDLEAKTGISRSTLSRIEVGDQTPSQEHARILFSFYAGEIPLAEIYDPLFERSGAGA